MSDFEFEKINTIKGYPELHWTGKRPYRSTDYYPAQLKEKYGEMKDGWINKIFWGDNLQVMSHMLKEYRGKIDLIYIDPPFDSKADYKKKISIRNIGVVTGNNLAFEDKQYSDLWINDEYLQFMYERAIIMKELLCDTGCIYIHCDWHKAQYLRGMLDEVFGIDCFQNEIIWQKIRTTKAQSLGFGNVTDHIFVYRKGKTCTSNIIYKNFDPTYIKTHYKKDERGRLYRTVSMLQRGQGDARLFGDKLIAPPSDMHWIWSQDRIDKAMKEGRIKFTSNGRPEKIQYLDEMQGDIVDDLWNDIAPLNSQALESENYPTQKPEALLERIINASSNPGDIVFDCFMGSGTTQAVAMKLGRKFIGADINLGSIQTTTKRLINVANELKEDNEKYTGFEVYNVNNYDFFRNPVEAKDLLIDALGIQKFDGNNVYDGELDGRMIKIMPVNRITTKSDLEELKANLPYQKFEKRKAENPLEPVERITIVCMGHESDIKPSLEQDLNNYNIDIEILDILKDKSNLQFKRDSEAVIKVKDNKLIVKEFYPMNLLQKLSLQKEYVEDWKQMVESIMIDWNYDGVVMKATEIDIPNKNELVKGEYNIPENTTNIKIKITDLLSETFEKEVRISE